MLRTLSIALCLAVLTTAACKKTEDTSADPSATAKVADPLTKLDPMAKGAVDTAAKAAEGLAAKAVDPGADPKMAALATEALSRLGQFKDKVCACTDRTCADKVQDEVTAWGKNLENTPMKDFKPDQAVTQKLDAIENEMAKCAAKASGEPMPDEPKQPAGPVGENNPTEAKALAMMDRMTTMFEADATNCEKLAVDLKKFAADNKAFMTELSAYEKAQTDASKAAFAARNKARTEAGSAKIGPVIQACSVNPAFQAALQDLPM